MKKYRTLIILLLLIGFVLFITSPTVLALIFAQKQISMQESIRQGKFRIVKPPSKEQADLLKKSKQGAKK